MRRKHRYSWLCLVASVAALVVSCRSDDTGRGAPAAERAARSVEESSELLVLDEGPAGSVRRLATEQAIEVGDRPAAPPRPVVRAAARPRPMTSSTSSGLLRAIERSIAESESREPEIPAPTEEVSPEPPRIAEVPAEVRPMPQPAGDRVPPRERRPGPYETAIDTALIVGAVGTGLGAVVASSDGAAGDQTFALAAVGIGAAGFSTALVLHFLEPEQKKTVHVTVAPGLIGVRGRF